jgi:hypothetical protein
MKLISCYGRERWLGPFLVIAYMCLGTETQALLNKQIWEKFMQELPMSERTEKSVTQRWSQMVSTFRFICDYAATYVNNSSGRGPWWELPEHKTKLILTKSKKVHHCRFLTVDILEQGSL